MNQRLLVRASFLFLSASLFACDSAATDGDGGGGAGTSSSSTNSATQTGAGGDGGGEGGAGEGGTGLGGAGGAGEGGAGTGGSGGSGGAGGAEPRLFVLNEGFGVTSYSRPAEQEGRIESLTRLDAGPDTDLFGPRDLVVDASGALVVVNQNDPSICIFDDARTATGARLPDRKVTGKLTGLGSSTAMVVDVDADLLYVADGNSIGDEAVLRWDAAATLDGDEAPSGRVVPPSPQDDAFDAIQMTLRDDRLYVVEQDENTFSIHVFDDASQLDATELASDREIRSEVFTSSTAAAYVDAQDRLFVVSFTDQIFMFEGASSLDGDVEPDVTLTLTGAQGLAAVVVDASDHLIAADRSRSFIYVLDAVSALGSGEVAPDREFDAVDLFSPRALFLVEE